MWIKLKFKETTAKVLVSTSSCYKNEVNESVGLQNLSQLPIWSGNATAVPQQSRGVPLLASTEQSAGPSKTQKPPRSPEIWRTLHSPALSRGSTHPENRHSQANCGVFWPKNSWDHLEIAAYRSQKGKDSGEQDGKPLGREGPYGAEANGISLAAAAFVLPRALRADTLLNSRGVGTGLAGRKPRQGSGA